MAIRSSAHHPAATIDLQACCTVRRDCAGCPRALPVSIVGVMHRRLAPMLGLLAPISSTPGFGADDAGTNRRAYRNDAASPRTGSLGGYYPGLPRGEECAVGIGTSSRLAGWTGLELRL